MDEVSNIKKQLLYFYILHFVLEIIILVFNIYYYISKLWVYLSFKIIFLIGIIIICVFLIFPLIPLFFIYIKNNSDKGFYNKNKKISFIFLILNVLIGVILSIIFWVNLSKFSSYYKDCPYNYSFSEFNKLNENNGKYKSNEICQKRICFIYEKNFINENNIILNNYYNNQLHNNNNYICSFDSSIDFKNDEVQCQRITFSSKNDFFNYCAKYIFYYLCERIKTPLKYNININEGCPLENKNSKISNIIDIFIILNIIFGFIPWVLEIIYLNKLLNKNENSQNQIENNNQQNINIISNEVQIQNLINRTNNTSEANTRRQNSQEIIDINININENNNHSLKEISQNNEENENNEQIEYLFIGNVKTGSNNNKKEDKKIIIQRSCERFKKNNFALFKENNLTPQIYNLINSPNINSLNSHTKNFENISKDHKSKIDEITINKKTNSHKQLYSLKKKNIKDKNIIINKVNRFVSINNNTLNYLPTNFCLHNNININLNDDNKSSLCENNKKMNTLEQLDKSYYSFRKKYNRKKDKENKANLSQTLKKNKKVKKRLMDNLYKLITSPTGLKLDLDN